MRVRSKLVGDVRKIYPRQERPRVRSVSLNPLLMTMATAFALIALQTPQRLKTVPAILP
jgi:hypothetical protein